MYSGGGIVVVDYKTIGFIALSVIYFFDSANQWSTTVPGATTKLIGNLSFLLNDSLASTTNV